MTAIEQWTVVVAIGTVVLFVGLILLLVLLKLAPNAVQQRVYTATARGNEQMFQFLGRASYTFAVFVVVVTGLTLIGAVALLFAPR